MTGYRVGLTGGVGSGKSTVAAMFKHLGAGIVDADAIVHELIAPGGAAIPLLSKTFGAAALAADGGLDRPAMRKRVFANPAKRRRLEQILHPMVRSEAERRAASLAPDVPYIALVIPLLVESGDWRSRVHRVLVVDCAEATQLQRVAARPGLDRTTATAILAAQSDRRQRLDAADDVLFNEAPLQEIAARVAQLHEMYVKSAAANGLPSRL
jgi:dephospho-CoA kinase